tara:strand:- start:608 stop:718 length:111 start_codon:yes stop_codon:yes gene_type:complete
MLVLVVKVDFNLITHLIQLVQILGNLVIGQQSGHFH